jgi:hypothetical protein
MARAIRIKVVKRGDRTDQIIRSVGIQLGRFDGRVEEGSGGDLLVIFSKDRVASEARHLVRERLDGCAEDWNEYLKV